MIIQIIKTVVFYFIMMYLSINILGFFVRGLYTNPTMDKLAKEGSDFIKKEAIRYNKVDKLTTIFALIIFVAFYYLLFRFFNMGVVISAVMIMGGRLPDLIWDIKHGRKTEPSLMKHDFWYYMSALMPFLAFPVFYYSLNYL